MKLILYLGDVLNIQVCASKDLLRYQVMAVAELMCHLVRVFHNPVISF